MKIEINIDDGDIQAIYTYKAERFEVSEKEDYAINRQIHQDLIFKIKNIESINYHFYKR